MTDREMVLWGVWGERIGAIEIQLECKGIAEDLLTSVCIHHRCIRASNNMLLLTSLYLSYSVNCLELAPWLNPYRDMVERMTFNGLLVRCNLTNIRFGIMPNIHA